MNQSDAPGKPRYARRVAKKRTKVRIVPRILKDAVRASVIPACVLAGTDCEKPPPPVVAYMPPPDNRPPSPVVAVYVPPPVVAQMIAPPVADAGPRNPPPKKP